MRRLRLVCCYSITDKGLEEAAAKLPLLEDLEISYHSLSEKPLEAVGQSCPLLKSLKLNCQGTRQGYMVYDNEAFAVAKTMTELRHLQIFGNELSNIGLQAILDGCPHLESLDLRQCFNLDLTGDLGKRCAQHVKHLQCPYDSTQSYEFNAEICDGYYDGSDYELFDEDDYYDHDISGGSELSDSENDLDFLDY